METMNKPTQIVWKKWTNADRGASKKFQKWTNRLQTAVNTGRNKFQTAVNTICNWATNVCWWAAGAAGGRAAGAAGCIFDVDLRDDIFFRSISNLRT